MQLFCHLVVAMVVSVVQSAKRILVSLLKGFAKKYGVPLDINRDSEDSEVRKAYRKVSRDDRGRSEPLHRHGH